MHVGSVTPGGFGWGDCIVKEVPRRLGGGVMKSSDMELLLKDKGITKTKFAEISGLDLYIIENYIEGRRSIPHDVALKILEL